MRITCSGFLLAKFFIYYEFNGEVPYSYGALTEIHLYSSIGCTGP
jgi:hypothetical protein